MRTCALRTPTRPIAVTGWLLLSLVGGSMPALAQQTTPLGPEAAVAEYHYFDPDLGGNGAWRWDQGIDATDAAHDGFYWNHDRDATDEDRLWAVRWGDPWQIIMEASLPIYKAPGTWGEIVMPAHNINGLDVFPGGVTIPAGMEIHVYGQWRYRHESWTEWSRAYRCEFVDPGEWTGHPHGGDDCSWLRDPLTGVTTGLAWPAVLYTHINVPDMPPEAAPVGTLYWFAGDHEPGSGVFTDTTGYAEWAGYEFRFDPGYTVVWTDGSGDVLYPNPFTAQAGAANLTPPSDAPANGELDQENPVIDWADPALTNFGTATEWEYANPMFLADGPNGEPRITSASLELVGPDLDPYTEGIQAPRKTITGGRLATAFRRSDITAASGDPTLASSWRDFDSNDGGRDGPPALRWDRRIPTAVQADEDDGALNDEWRRIVRIAFGGTGYPGTRGADNSVHPPTIEEGLFPYWDDPDAFVVGPTPGLKYETTRDPAAPDNVSETAYGVAPTDRAYAPDPYDWSTTETQGARTDCAFTPGYWTIQNLTLTVCPDPSTPDVATSFRTVVIPVYPTAPWQLPTPGNPGAALPDEQKPRNWFAVEHPLDVQIARQDEESPEAPDWDADEPGSGRFGFWGNPGEHEKMRPDTPAGATDARMSGWDVDPANTDDHRYFLAQGNHDFLTRLPSDETVNAIATPADWDERYYWEPSDVPISGDPDAYVSLGDWDWMRDDWTDDRDPDTGPWNDEPILNGWVLPLADLGSGSPGRSAGWARTGDNREDDGLWLSNASHVTLFRKSGPVLIQTDASPTVLYDTEPDYLQHDGPGIVRFAVPPLRPIIAESDDWDGDPPVVVYTTALATDYNERPLPNGSYPSIPGSNLRMWVGGKDIARHGLPALSSRRSNGDRTQVVSRESAWYVDDNSNSDDGTRDDADTIEPQRVNLVAAIPPHQPAMAAMEGTTDHEGDWRYPSDELEILGDADPPIGYYGTLDPDDATVPDYSGPGAEVTDYQSGSATLSYTIDPADDISEDAYMVKAYIDVNGNGKLDLARVDLADRAYGTGSSPADPYWHRFLYEEPYRSFAVRLKVLPDYAVGAGRRVADLGIVGHATPRGPSGLPAWQSLVEHNLSLEQRGNMPANVLPADPGEPFPRLSMLGAFGMSTQGWRGWISDEAEQGIIMPIERLMPNYVSDMNANTIGWSSLPAPPGVKTDSGGIFVDGMSSAPDGVAQDDERLGARVTADAAGAGTPVGTYFLDLFTFADVDRAAGYNPDADTVVAGPTAVKATVSESPIPPVLATLGNSREVNKDAGTDSSPAGLTIPANANTSFGDLGGAFFMNTWDVDSATGLPNVLGGGYGDTAVYFTSNRPSFDEEPLLGHEQAWNMWAQRLDHNFDPGSDPWRPIHPTFEPVDDAFEIAGHPCGLDGAVGGGDDLVSPPEARFVAVNSYKHHSPSLVRQPMAGPDSAPLVVVTWTLEVEWSEDPNNPNPQVAKSYYNGGVLVSSADANLGEVIVGPLFVEAIDGAQFGPKPLLIPRGSLPATEFDLYMYYYKGSGSQRRLGYLLWEVIAPDGMNYLGSHEIPIMTRYGSGGVRLDGLEYAKDPHLFADVWYGEDPANPGAGIWHGGPLADVRADIGVVFSGKTTSFETEDVFYTRFDPDYPTDGPLNDPMNYDPTNNNTGQVMFPEQTDAPLTPLRQEALTIGGASPAERYHGAYASERWVDWVYDPDPANPAGGIQFSVSVAGGPTWGPGDWLEDPISGYLYAENADGGREVEVDPTVGMVRFVAEDLVPNQETEVTATFTPQTMRLTRAAQDSGQPTVVVLPAETIEVPYEEADSTPAPGETPQVVRTPVELPMRLFLLYKRFDAQGRVRLLYETFSMPFTHPSAPAPPSADQLYWRKVSDPDAAVAGDAYPLIAYPVDGSAEYIPFYVDRPATAIPLDETAGELFVTAQPVRYTWFTDQRNLDTSDPARAKFVPPFVALGSTVNVTGPLGDQTLQQVGGPTVVWLMFSSTAEKTRYLQGFSGQNFEAPGEHWRGQDWGVYGTDDGIAYGYDADWDLYFAPVSPQAIPRTTVYDTSTQS